MENKKTCAFAIRAKWPKPQFIICPVCNNPAHVYYFTHSNGERYGHVHCMNGRCGSYCTTEKFRQMTNEELAKTEARIIEEMAK